MIPHSRARGEEDFSQLRRAGLRQGPVELEEARRLAEPVDLALAQRRRRLADVVEGGGGFLLLAVAGLCANQPVSRVQRSRRWRAGAAKFDLQVHGCSRRPCRRAPWPAGRGRGARTESCRASTCRSNRCPRSRARRGSRAALARRRAPAQPPRPPAVAPPGVPSRAWLGSFLSFVCRVVSRVCGLSSSWVATESCPATLNEQIFAISSLSAIHPTRFRVVNQTNTDGRARSR